MGTTVIRNISWLVACEDEEHVYRRDVDFAFENGVATFIGKDFKGDVERDIDGRNRLVMPGLVNIHSHPASEPLRKGITDETLSPGFHHSSLYEFLTVFDNDEEGKLASLRVALAELLLSGCTTLVDISAPHEGWVEALASSGIRAVVAPSFRSGRWLTRNGHSLEYEWDEAAGRRAFEGALATIDAARRHVCGRLDGMVMPAQVDTCTEELLRDSFAAAVERDLPWQTHAAQSVAEFHEMFKRHGRSPVRFLERLGVLSQRSILGHAIFLDHHPRLHWTTKDDLDILADHGTTVAHCPTVFARRGISLNSFGGYRRHGVNVGIGTDTYPHYMLDEMRNAGYFARVSTGTVADHCTNDVFHAATIGGAKALGREDIGRLAVGAKADFVVADITHRSMRPMREPLRNLIFVAGERPITEVWVDGRRVASQGRVTAIDLDGELENLEAAQSRSLARTRQLDWAGRTAGQLAPMMLPTKA